jgi:glycosyltransferase involved in cell wall biosynthesis
MSTPIRALAWLLPVVISYQLYNPAEISDSDAGIVTRCDDSEVAQALQTLLTDPGQRHAMGLAGRRLVESQYTWPPIVEELTRQYEAVIARSSRNNDRVSAAGRATGEKT